VGQRINVRAQDGLKCRFLCDACEGRLSAWETTFARDFFLPFHEQAQTTFEYGEWMAKFCVSVSWRALSYMQQHCEHAKFDRSFAPDAAEALSVWADFLLGKRPDIGRFEQHLLPFGAISDADGNLPANMQRYLVRAVEIDRLCNNQSAVTFAKLGHVILVGFVREPEAPLWKGTKVDIDKGTIAPQRLEVPHWLLKYLAGRANRLAQLESGLSLRQREAIGRTQRLNAQRVAESETLQARLEDKRLRRGRSKTDVGDD